MGRQSPLSTFPPKHRTLVAGAILGILILVLPGQTPPERDADPVIEVIEVEFPYWRLIFYGEVEGVPEPTELEAHHITRLDAGFRPLLERTERRARDAASTTVWAEATFQGRVIGQAPNAYEVMETSRGDRVPSLLGSIENLRQLPETFSLVHRQRGELLEMVAAPESPEFELTRLEHRDGAVELAWTEPEEGRTPHFEVFLSTDGFESYTRVHPEFYGEGAREVMRNTTAFTFDPSRHYVVDEAYYLLVLANEGLRTAWKAVRVTPPEEPSYEYQATIHDPEEGDQIWQDGFVTLSGSMAARIETPEHRFVGRPYRLQPVPATLEWISSQDGSIVRYRTDGSVFGVTCMARGLSAGPHRIILRTETPGGTTARTSARVQVVQDGERPPERSFDCRVPEEFRIDG